jgi:cytochrome c5
MPKSLAVALVVALGAWIAPGSGAAQNAERSGKEVVDAVCVTCHGTGANGAPKIGDKKAWSKLASRGLTGLSQSALKGIRKMPPHGGNLALTDTEVERAITYMVNQSGGHWTEPVGTSAPAERSGEQVVKAQCVKCHETGVGGAPKIGDRVAWIPRFKQGVDPLVRSAINGHGGMPARGGLANLTDQELRSAIVYMFSPVTAAAPQTRATPSAASGQDFAVVGNTTVYFGIVPGDVIRSHPEEYPKKAYGVPPAAPAQYYVTVALFDTTSGQRIEDAVVKARVATAAGSGREQTLQPVTIANSRGYGNYLSMGGTGTYKVTVNVRRPGSPDAVQAQFEYTHQ